MTKGHFPEVRSMIEFDRLAKNHLMDAYSQLLPTTKRLLRKLSTSEPQIILQQQVQQSFFSEKDINSISSSSSEKLVPSLSANKVLGPANRIGSAHDILRIDRILNPRYSANKFAIKLVGMRLFRSRLFEIKIILMKTHFCIFIDRIKSLFFVPPSSDTPKFTNKPLIQYKCILYYIYEMVTHRFNSDFL